MIRLFSVCLSLFLAAGPAAAVTINFDDIPLAGSSHFQTQGFEFWGNYGLRENTASYAGDLFLTGMAGFFNPDFEPGIVAFRRVDLAPFAIYSADLFYGGSIAGQTSTGQRIDAASAAEFGSGAWLDVTFVEVRVFGAPGLPVSVDNLVLGAAVPVPAAVWLFVSGLGLLGWIRSRQNQGAGKVSA